MAVKVGVISLGCPKNLVDTEIMLGLLSDAGYVITPEAADADVMVINTCGFITPAKEEAVGAILEAARLKEEGRLKALLVAGCLAKRYGGELLAEIPEIDGVFSPGEIGSVAILVEKALAGERPKAVESPEYDYSRVAPRLLTTPAHWAYIKIAEGCNNRCAYCAIPGIRGGYRSRPVEVLEEEAAGLLKRGVREIILVAQDTTAYGADLYGRPRLAGLLERLAALGPSWIRVMYCYPTGFTPELIRVMGREENICRYVDLPLQHINDGILKKMNRRGTSEDIRRLIAGLRDSIPGLTLRTTFMVGFPGEGEAEFEELYRFVEETRFERMGVFKFSPEEGTPAAEMADTVPEEVKEYRYNSLMSLQKEISRRRNSGKVNTCVRVMVDGKRPGRGNLYYGRTEGDAPEIDGSVLFSAGPGGAAAGEFVSVRITRAFDYGLRGVLVR
ncbi:MAG: 30S ribosomal protein S12 methylthiotransferase RimO [Peptococcaceae bacterium]|nr:30S ribosomal protein S12 methylthiotransferase RimO [Peptococcaceae bacterium]